MKTLQGRYHEFLKKKGRISSAEPEMMMSSGGQVGDEDEWQEGHWNDHDDDTSGEPDKYDTSNGFAFGGEIVPPDHGDEGHPEMSMEEVHHHLAQALKRRKQLRPGA